MQHTASLKGQPVNNHALLGIQGVGKTFGHDAVVALNEINLDIRDNELFTLLGPSGCGKTTLLRIMAGFEHPTSGRVLLEGRDISGDAPHKRPLNTMFQSYALFPHLTVGENIAFGLKMLRWKKPDIVRRTEEVLSLVHLSGFEKRRTTEMSGGQQQRIALARALAPRPRVLLLDEPLSALDLKLRRAMQTELKRLQKETAVTFVMVTHDQEEALALSDRIAVMSRGEVLQLGSPWEIYNNPTTCFVADFIGEANLINGEILGAPKKYTISIRPEKIQISQNVGGSGKRSVGCTLTNVTYLGADTLAEARTDAGLNLRARVREALQGTPGERIYFVWSESDERKLTQ